MQAHQQRHIALERHQPGGFCDAGQLAGEIN
jgi:hypothetical protein